MKTTNEIKKWIKEKFNLTVKGNTSPGKAKWQSFYIPCDHAVSYHHLSYSQPPFPEEFRKLCIRTVYPTSPDLHTQVRAGNVDFYSISMSAFEWELVTAIWNGRHPNRGYEQFLP